MGFRAKNKEQRSKTGRREKFRVQNYELRVKRKFRVQSYEFRVKPQKSELRTPYSELNIGGCGMGIGGGLPCGRFLAVSGKR